MLNYVSVVLDLYDGQGNAINTGSVSFVPSAQLTDTTDQEIIFMVPIIGYLNTGHSLKLLATDSANITPSVWQWVVTFSGVPGNPPVYSFSLAYANGATQHLSALL